MSEPGSIPDLCLAWNLRAQRFPSTKLPVWLKPDWLAQEDVRRNILFALRITHPGLSEGRSRTSRVHFISMSLSIEEMEGYLVNLPHQYMLHGSTSATKFFTDKFETGRTESTIAYFRDGFSHVNLPDHRDMAAFRRFDDLEWSVNIDAYQPPIPPQRHYHLAGGTFRSFRLSSEGISGGLGSHEPSRTLVPLGAYVGFEVVEGLAESVGYEAEISDKGQLAISVLQLLGGSTGLSVVASSLVFALLRKMSLVNKRQSIQSALATLLGRSPTGQEVDDAERTVQDSATREVSPDRQFFRWSQLKESLAPAADPVDRAIVKWLADHQIIFRGVELRCANCNLRGWYVIDRLSNYLRPVSVR